MDSTVPADPNPDSQRRLRRRPRSPLLLLADDSVTLRKVVELTFSHTPFRVVAVGSGKEALDRLRHAHHDLVLADVGMPEPAGYEICRRVKESKHPVPVLLLVGANESYDAERARSCGADGYLTKPFESRALRDRVRLLVEPPGGVVHEGSTAAETLRVHMDEALPPGTIGTRGPEDRLAPEMIDAIAERVVERMSTEMIREIATEVVPRVARDIITKRIRELEREDPAEGH